MRARCRSGGDLRNAGSSRPGDGRGETAPVAMQSRVQLLVEEAHARAAASWHRLQVAPEDLVRVAGSWSAAWQSGDGLRAVIYGLILLLIGGGVEWLYWCYAGCARLAIAEAAMAGSDDAALAPRCAADLSSRRALLEACGCTLFAISTIAASSAFTWPAGVQEAVVGFTFLVATTRLTGIAVRVILAPDCPRLRLRRDRFGASPSAWPHWSPADRRCAAYATRPLKHPPSASR